MKIIYGSHWTQLPGWTILTEANQDITKPLKLDDNVADCIFTEHVVEHLELSDAINFFKEALRVLKPEGILRTVMPMYERLVNEKIKWPAVYFKNNILPYYQKEDEILIDLGFNIYDYCKIFQLNALYRECGHKFIWGQYLLQSVLLAIGFENTRICKYGDGTKKEYCIEHRQRGIERSNDPEKEKGIEFIDNEGFAVEGIK